MQVGHRAGDVQPVGILRDSLEPRIGEPEHLLDGMKRVFDLGADL